MIRNFIHGRYLRQLNIDKDILSMKNFNVYDPMKRGQGLILDGQTLAHIEVYFLSRNEPSVLNGDGFTRQLRRSYSTMRALKTDRC